MLDILLLIVITKFKLCKKLISFLYKSKGKSKFMNPISESL